MYQTRRQTYKTKPKAAIAPAARAPRPYCCPTLMTTAAPVAIVVLEDGAALVTDPVPAAVADVDGAEEVVVDIGVALKVPWVESRVPQVELISVLH